MSSCQISGASSNTTLSFTALLGKRHSHLCEFIATGDSGCFNEKVDEQLFRLVTLLSLAMPRLFAISESTYSPCSQASIEIVRILITRSTGGVGT